jgi:hypothetical protein
VIEARNRFKSFVSTFHEWTPLQSCSRTGSAPKEEIPMRNGRGGHLTVYSL